MPCRPCLLGLTVDGERDVGGERGLHDLVGDPAFVRDPVLLRRDGQLVCVDRPRRVTNGGVVQQSPLSVPGDGGARVSPSDAAAEGAAFSRPKDLAGPVAADEGRAWGVCVGRKIGNYMRVQRKQGDFHLQIIG